MPKTQSDPIDVHVGQTLRVLRLAKRVSQTAVADVLGVTFQQVQKYENGKNRVSPSRLAKLAKFFGVPVSRFFEDQRLPKTDEKFALDVLTQPLALRAVQAVVRVRNMKTRLSIVHLIEEIAEGK